MSMSTSAVKVQVVADDEVSELGVRAQLRGQPGVRILESGAGDEAEVTIVVSDAMDDATARALRRARGNSQRPVVSVVNRIDDAGLMTAVEAGASAIVPRRDATPERLAHATCSVANGNGDLSSDLLGRLLEQVGNLQRSVLAPRGLNPTGLTDREVEVLRLVADGCDTAEIAASLCYSERTVKSVIHDITTRLQLRNRAHAVAYAVRAGLI